MSKAEWFYVDLMIDGQWESKARLRHEWQARQQADDYAALGYTTRVATAMTRRRKSA
jgi:hypothetical protein